VYLISSLAHRSAREIILIQGSFHSPAMVFELKNKSAKIRKNNIFDIIFICQKIM
jgi:hypothetical protein